MTVLVADVGGTNTRVGLSRDGTVPGPSIARYRNAEFAALSDLLGAYLRERAVARPDRVCVAVAGPVRHGLGRLTNRDWIISEDELCRATGAARGIVINDLSAQGHALDAVVVRPLFADAPALPDPSETRLVVGIGTGFNAAPVYRGAAGLTVVPSECGHVSLPVWDEASATLAQGLRTHHGFASVEDALSGRGLPQSFRILTGHAPPDDPSDIFDHAARDPDGPAGRTVATLVAVLGRVLGDLALVHLPFGGIVLIGGMARAFLPFLSPAGFLDAMRDKGRFSEFMTQFPLYVLEDDFAALQGCALVASDDGARAASRAGTP